MKKNTYELEVAGTARELCWQSLTDDQAKYWKKRDEEELAEYISCEPADREDEFPEVPENAHIAGYWDELRDIYHGYGPDENAECTLYRLTRDGEREELWSCEISALSATYVEKQKPEKARKATPLSKHILVNMTEEDVTLSYVWKNVSKEPRPDDFGLGFSPDDSIVDNIQLFKGLPSDRSGDGDVDGRDVWISTPKKLRL
jgi:hypothetical protein